MRQSHYPPAPDHHRSVSSRDRPCTQVLAPGMLNGVNKYSGAAFRSNLYSIQHQAKLLQVRVESLLLLFAIILVESQEKARVGCQQ